MLNTAIKLVHSGTARATLGTPSQSGNLAHFWIPRERGVLHLCIVSCTVCHVSYYTYISYPYPYPYPYPLYHYYAETTTDTLRKYYGYVLLRMYYPPTPAILKVLTYYRRTHSSYHYGRASQRARTRNQSPPNYGVHPTTSNPVQFSPSHLPSPIQSVQSVRSLQ